MVAIAGFGAFIAILFAIGSFMEENWRKLGISAAVFVTLAFIAMQGPRAPDGPSTHCSRDWDGFSNSEVCD